MMRRRWFAVCCVGLGLGAANLCAVPSASASDPSAAPSSHFPAVAAMNLTAAQQQKLTDLGNWSQGQARQMYEQVHKLRDRLSDLYSGYIFDTAEARRINGELNRVQGQLLTLHLNEQQQLRSILTPEQFVQLQAALKQQDGWRKQGGWNKHAPVLPPDHAGPDAAGRSGSH